MNEWMSSDCDREHRKLLKEIRINDREESMEDMKLKVVLEGREIWKRQWG